MKFPTAFSTAVLAVLVAGGARADSDTHYAFKPKRNVADVDFSGLDLRYQIVGKLAYGVVTCVARGEKSVNKRIDVDFFVIDNTGDGAFFAAHAADKLPVSDTADSYCGTGFNPIADPHRTPTGMRVKVTNSDTKEFTEVDLELLGPPVVAGPPGRKHRRR